MRSRLCTVGIALSISATSIGCALGAVPTTAAAPAGATAAPSAALPFDMPAADVLHGSPKKVFAHYMTTFPLSIDNAPSASDYYATQYLLASGESGKFASSGGFIRERPLPVAVNPSASWSSVNMQTEVARASAAGIDGFSVDILGLSGVVWDRIGQMMQAARAVDPNFKIMIMPDVSAGVAANSDALAAGVAALAADPAAYRLDDGRLVVSPFYAEGRSADWWRQWIATMQSRYGITVAFVPTFLDAGSAASFASISYGFSDWGSRNPGAIDGAATAIKDAHARGKIWMQPVALQDERPYAGVYDEAGNTETLRGQWAVAIGQSAEWVQLTTWNDYAEGSEISPSSRIGWSPLDLTAFDINRFKTGAAPAIVRDVLYVSHRTQRAEALPTGPQTMLMHLRPGTTSPRNTVEVQAFLRNAGIVSVVVGGSRYTYNAPAGRSTADFPLAVGQVSAAVSYADGTALQVVSPFTVVDRPAVQDLGYAFASSARSGQTIAMPMPTTITSPPATPVLTAPGIRTEDIRVVPSAEPVPATPVVDATVLAAPGGFTAVPPLRLADTRSGLGGGRLARGTVRRIQVTGVGTVPTGATAASVNLTVAASTDAGYVSAYGCGPVVPGVSTVNFSAAAVVANAAIVPLDATGGICVFANVDVDVIVDINGYVHPAGPGRLVPVAPRRVVDTRDESSGVHRLTGGQPVEVPFPTGSDGLPSVATAVSLNVTAVGAASATFVTIYPCTSAIPLVSTVNVAGAAPQSNAAIVGLSATGTVCLFSPHDVDVVVDLAGYITNGPGLRFTPLAPTRLIDTRDGQPALNLGLGGTPMAAGSMQTIAFAGLRGIPAGAAVVSLNVTTTGTAGMGFVTAWPCAGDRPVVSSLNAMQGRAVSAAVTNGLSASGTACFFTQASTHLVIDINGVWSA
ncbi:MAG: hypothetical protein JWN62_4163 [Acidimicrobiales bacterium]|nr:hypothetical protein [Acidimicrobiales bacterium]